MFKESDFKEIKESWRKVSSLSKQRRLMLWDIFPICMGRNVRSHLWSIEVGTFATGGYNHGSYLHGMKYTILMYKNFSIKNLVEKMNEYKNYKRNAVCEGLIDLVFSSVGFQKKL